MPVEDGWVNGDTVTAADMNEIGAAINALESGGGGGGVTPTGTTTFTNKTIALGSNTVTMTKAQLNTAITDGDAYVTGGTDVPIADGGTGVSTLPTGLLKGAGTAAITAAVAGVDYALPSATSLTVPPLPNAVDVEPVTTTGTVSVVANSFTTTIASGVLAVDLTTQMNLVGLVGTSTTNMVTVASVFKGPGWKPDFTTGNIGTNVTAPWSVDIWVSGSRYVEFVVGRVDYTVVAGYAYRVWIDGRRKTDFAVTTGLGTLGQAATIKVDLGSGVVNAHRVRLEMSAMAMSAIWVQAAGTVWAAKTAGPRLFILGPSTAQSSIVGTNSGYELGTYVSRLSNLIGVSDVWNDGEGGTGPNSSSSGYTNYKTRATTTVIPAAPDIVLLDTWVNDQGAGRTAAQIAADYGTTIDTIKAALPNVKCIIVGGIDSTGGTYTSTMTTIDTAVEATAVTKGAAFMSGVTGRVIGFDGTLLATTGKWITTANAGLYISSVDNFHPSDAGHEYFAYLMRDAWRLIFDVDEETGGAPPSSGGSVTTSSADTFTNKTIGDKLDFNAVTAPSAPSGGTRFYTRTGISGLDAPAWIGSLGVPMVIGRDIGFYAKNITGSTITKGSVVYVASATSSVVNIAKAQADATGTKMPAVGVMAADIANNTFGLVMQYGVIQNVNTAGMGDGAIIYLDATTAGAITSTRPTHPLVAQMIGVVLNSNTTTGSILVTVTQHNPNLNQGTNGASWGIGDGTGSAAKTVAFKNSNTGTLTWTPTGTRTITLPDGTGTVYISGGTDVPITDGGTGVSTLPTGILKGAGTGAITAVTAPSGTVVGTSDTQTLTGKWVQPRVTSPAVAGTYTVDWTACDQYVIGTQNAAITNLTATGTAVDGQKLLLRIKGDATPRTIAWDSAKYVSSGVATLLATTAASKTHFVGLVYDGVLAKMVCVAVDSVGY
jgi:hypothetical protein